MVDTTKYLFTLGYILLSRYSVLGNFELQYIGCYIDSGNDRAILEQSINLGNSTTAQNCIEYCANRGYTYAGLQIKDCFCGHSYAKHGTATCNSDCDEPCIGNISQICGGKSRVTLYTVCPFGTFGEDCAQTCPNYHCVPVDHGVCHFKTGECLSTECKYGYKYCMNTENDCLKIKGDPREVLNVMNYEGGIWLNLFTTLTFTKQAQVAQIEYYTHSIGQMYVSFWRMVPDHSKKWMMIGKILINANITGYQRYNVPLPETVVVNAGDAVGIHYPSGSRAGILYYETHDRLLSNNISLKDLHPSLAVNMQDRGWKAGAIINFEPSSTGWERTPSIHITLDCFRECGNCKDGSPCDLNDNCQNTSCDAGFKGSKCNEECEDGYFGENCQLECGNCKTQPCNKIDGSCPDMICRADDSGYGIKNGDKMVKLKVVLTISILLSCVLLIFVGTTICLLWKINQLNQELSGVNTGQSNYNTEEIKEPEYNQDIDLYEQPQNVSQKANIYDKLDTEYANI